MNDNKYLSKYSNGKYVSAAQYITEIICENKALKDGSDLHYRFWTTKKWSVFYRNQIASAHKLLEKYTAQAIIKALNSPEGKKIFSLRAPHLSDIIEKYTRIIENQNTKLTKKLERNSGSTFRKSIHKENILSKLRNIDNES
jgi:hypothetical protein